MSALDFLVELGTEELPPKALNTLAEAFLAGIDKGLQAAGLNYETKTVYAAPRRLAVLITSLATQQPDRSILSWAPLRPRSMPKATRPRQHWALPRSAAST
jgi:glycyl-tRNA synthetase beta chain